MPMGVMCVKTYTFREKWAFWQIAQPLLGIMAMGIFHEVQTNNHVHSYIIYHPYIWASYIWAWCSWASCIKCPWTWLFVCTSWKMPMGIMPRHMDGIWFMKEHDYLFAPCLRSMKDAHNVLQRYLWSRTGDRNDFVECKQIIIYIHRLHVNTHRDIYARQWGDISTLCMIAPRRSRYVEYIYKRHTWIIQIDMRCFRDPCIIVWLHLRDLYVFYGVSEAAHIYLYYSRMSFVYVFYTSRSLRCNHTMR